MGDRRIFALTLIQPWAELIVRGPKRVENRSWAPRGMAVGDYLAIHAGAKLDVGAWNGAVETADAAGLLESLPVLQGYDDLPEPARGDRFGAHRARSYCTKAVPYSAIVGVARLAGVETEKAPRDPWCFDPNSDPWFFGPVGWRLDKVVAIDPVPCAGAQGLWTMPPDVLVEVRERWGRATGVRRAG